MGFLLAGQEEYGPEDEEENLAFSCWLLAGSSPIWSSIQDVYLDSSPLRTSAQTTAVEAGIAAKSDGTLHGVVTWDIDDFDDDYGAAIFEDVTSDMAVRGHAQNSGEAAIEGGQVDNDSSILAYSSGQPNRTWIYHKNLDIDPFAVQEEQWDRERIRIFDGIAVSASGLVYCFISENWWMWSNEFGGSILVNRTGSWKVNDNGRYGEYLNPGDGDPNRSGYYLDDNGSSGGWGVGRKTLTYDSNRGNVLLLANSTGWSNGAVFRWSEDYNGTGVSWDGNLSPIQNSIAAGNTPYSGIYIPEHDMVLWITADKTSPFYEYLIWSTDGGTTWSSYSFGSVKGLSDIAWDGQYLVATKVSPRQDAGLVIWDSSQVAAGSFGSPIYDGENPLYDPSVTDRPYYFNTIAAITGGEAFNLVRRVQRDDGLDLGSTRVGGARNGPTSQQLSLRRGPRGSYL